MNTENEERLAKIEKNITLEKQILYNTEMIIRLNLSLRRLIKNQIQDLENEKDSLQLEKINE